jgi:uncharacterized protein YkwD
MKAKPACTVPLERANNRSQSTLKTGEFGSPQVFRENADKPPGAFTLQLHFKKTRLTGFLACLGIAVSACNPKTSIVDLGQLQKTQDVSGRVLIVSFVVEPSDKRVYAITQAAPETSQSHYCTDTDTGQPACPGGAGLPMVFLKRTEAGFFFISRDPITVPVGTRLRFDAFIAANGSEPTQTAVATFIRPSDALPTDTLPDNTLDSTDPGYIPVNNPQNQGIPANMLAVLLGQFLGGLSTTGTITQPTYNPVTNPTYNPTYNPVSNPAVNPVSNPVTPTTATDAELVPNPTGVQLSASEFQVIKLTNAERRRKGKAALIVQDSIMRTSRESSRLMQQQNSMVHGLTSGWNGENIAQGYSTPEEVVQGWITSPGHYANMMGDFRYIGAGDTLSSGGGSPYWTQQFNN